MKKMMYLLMMATLLITSAMASSDPFAGKWVLDPHRSKYPTGTCPKRLVIEMEPAGRGIHYRSDTTYANGYTTHVQYTADYKGKQAIVTGAHGFLLPVSLKRMDSHSVIASYTKMFQVVATSRRVVSQDGRQMTITTTSRDQSGKKVTTVGVYKRQSIRDLIARVGGK